MLKPIFLFSLLFSSLLTADNVCTYEDLVAMVAPEVSLKTAKRRVERLDATIRSLAEEIRSLAVEEPNQSKKERQRQIAEKTKNAFEALEKLDRALPDEMALLKGVRVLELSEEAKRMDAQEYFPLLMGGFRYRPALRPLNPNILKTRRLTIDNKGRLRLGDKRFTSGSHDGETFYEGAINFVLLEDGEIYIGNEHHSVIAGEAKVICAGTLTAKDGFLTMITEESGHYLPAPSYLLRALHVLHHKGVDLSRARLSIRYLQTELPSSLRR